VRTLSSLTVDARSGTKVELDDERMRLPLIVVLAAAAGRQVLFGSLRCIVDGVHLVVGRHMRLIHSRQNVFNLVKLGCFAVVPCRVLMMFSRTLMEFAQR
jgi:hypothetical protein